MSRDLISKWYNKISASERTKPIVILNGGQFSPQQIFDEVMRGTPNANQLQQLVEQGRYGTTPEEELELLKMRLTGSLIENPEPDKKKYVTIIPGVGPQAFSPRELANEIQNETPIGKQWINAESSYIRAVLRVR